MLAEYKKYLDTDMLKLPFLKDLPIFNLFFTNFTQNLPKSYPDAKQLKEKLTLISEAISWLFLSVNFYQNINQYKDERELEDYQKTEKIFDKNKKYILLADLFLSKAMQIFSNLKKPLLEKIFYEKITKLYKKSIFTNKQKDYIDFVWYLSFLSVDVLFFKKKGFFFKYFLKFKFFYYFTLKKISAGMYDQEILLKISKVKLDRNKLLKMACYSIMEINQKK